MECDDDLPLSGLQHVSYCERQAALIHVDGVWSENASTAAGRIIHERVDTGDATRRPDVTILRAVALKSTRLQIVGIADVVEIHTRGGKSTPYPVEYKRGARPKKARSKADDVQLGAQAMALEEMMNVSITEGAIFHAKSQRRRIVPIDAALRTRVVQAAARFHELVRTRTVPPPVRDARCDDCSLRDACGPDRLVPTNALIARLREAFVAP